MSAIFNISEQQAKLSGIYVIRNKNNNKIYVGSAVNLQERFLSHFAKLRSSTHANKHLQSSFNKNGEDIFIFNLLEIVENRDILLQREQHYIDTLQPHYNIAKQAGRPPNIEWTEEMREKHSDIMRTRVLSEESIQRMLDGLTKGRNNYHQRSEESKAEHRKNISKSLTGRTLSEEHRKKVAVARLGTTISNEHKQAIRQANSNSYIIIDPQRNQYEVNDGLLTFAKQHGLDESSLAKCARGKRKHVKGWQCFHTEEFIEDKVKDPTSFRIRCNTKYIVTKPDSTEETTTNLYEFARQHGLDDSCLRKVALGILPQHKGYTVREITR